jgi:hypothetical protein
MEQTERSETSAHKIQTPGNHPKERMQQSFKTVLYQNSYFNASSGLLYFFNAVFTLHSRYMFVMHYDVKEEIYCLMICSFCLCMHFLVLLWPDNGPSFGPKLVAL